MGAGEDRDGFVRCPVYTYDGSAFSKATADIVRETPLQVFLNGRHIVTTACTGLHVEELALGFLKSEGLIGSSAEIREIRTSPERTAVHIDAAVPTPAVPAIAETIASSGSRGTGKGLPAPAGTDSFFITPDRVLQAMEKFIAATHLHRITRGTHCAALTDGHDILIAREDIGRHNALDMVVGHALLGNMDCRDKALLRTGRVSAEILQKVRILGTPVVISLAVPTSLAIRLAEAAGITLIGAIRGKSMQVYTHERRIGL